MSIGISDQIVWLEATVFQGNPIDEELATEIVKSLRWLQQLLAEALA